VAGKVQATVIEFPLFTVAIGVVGAARLVASANARPPPSLTELTVQYPNAAPAPARRNAATDNTTECR
jgi:hypothetical protein